MSEPARQVPPPLPALEGFTKAFYEFCRAGELRFQRCTACGTWRHVPRERCGACGDAGFEWARSSGRGIVYTWTTIARALHPAFAGETPYAAVVVEMEEGVRLLSRVVDVPLDALAIGLPVEVVFEAVTPEVTLPRFRRRAGERS